MENSLLTLALAFVAFIIGALILRGIFAIKRIVDLLTTIAHELHIANASRGPGEKPKTAPLQGSLEEPSARPRPPANAGPLLASDLSAGDEVTAADGRHLTIVAFKGRDLVVKDAAGKEERIPPVNPGSGAAERAFPVGRE